VEVWTLSQVAEKRLNFCERKVLRKIYRPTLVNGQWRKRYKNEIYNLYKEKEMEIARNIGLRRFQ
jgi:hypothetical protein